MPLFSLSSSPISNGKIVSVLSEETNAAFLRGFLAAISKMSGLNQKNIELTVFPYSSRKECDQN